MHRGVQQLIDWIQANAKGPGNTPSNGPPHPPKRPSQGAVAAHEARPALQLNSPTQAADLARLEERLGTPLPADLRTVLLRFNGGVLPTGRMLSVSPPARRASQPPVHPFEPGRPRPVPSSAPPPDFPTIEAVMQKLAQELAQDPDVPDLLPFFETADGGWLAFDRSGGPVPDTWPVVDYHPDTGEVRLVFRTFDGWCRFCVAELSDPKLDEPFTLEAYLDQGLRHARIEPDVATAHATVAHALRRSGRPEEAMESYLRAARCVPPQPWCDWEALKLATLLHDERRALEAATRLCARGPDERWQERETTPGKVADVIGRLATRSAEQDTWLRLFDQLAEQSMDAGDRQQIHAVRKAVFSSDPLPAARASRISKPPRHDDLEGWWRDVQQGYREGRIRDEDLLLDPTLDPLRKHKDFSEVLRIRREF